MRLNQIYSDGMILQRDRKVNIAGTGVPGELIRVEIDGISAETIVGDAGQIGSCGTGAGQDEPRGISEENIPWQIELPPHAAGGPYEMLVTGTIGGAASQKRIRDVLYGEVWFLNGQSNIEYALADAKGGREELSSADHDSIRYYPVFKASNVNEEMLEEESKTTWKKCKSEIDGSKNDFGDVSAIGYLTAVRVQKELGVPIGLIDCYVGGCSVTTWIDMERLKKLPEADVYLDNYFDAVNSKTPEEYEREIREYEAEVAAYDSRKAEMQAENPDITPDEIAAEISFPWPPPMGDKSLFKPSGLYNAMAKRVIPYTISAICYYQGEEDSPRYNRYKVLLKEMIAQYREDWRDETLPIYIFQLPMYNEAGLPENYEWPNQRLVQAEVVEEDENAELITLIDTGAYGEIHPWDKAVAARRLADCMLKKAGHMTIKNIIRNDDSMLLEFDNSYGVVQLRENELTDAVSGGNNGLLNMITSTVYGFEVSEDGNVWNKAEAVIESDKIRLITIDAEENYDFSSIAYVRYAFYSYGIVNIYNAKKEPLVPFVYQL